MKHLGTFSWLMLILFLMGCQTTAQTLDNTPSKPVETAQAEPQVEPRKAPEKFGKQEDLESMEPAIEVFSSMKPVLCGKADEVLKAITDKSNEKPIGFWNSSTHGHPVLLLLNKKTGTTTVLEYPSPVIGCIISVGVNAKFKAPTAQSTGTSISYISDKRDLPIAP